MEEVTASSNVKPVIQDFKKCEKNKRNMIPQKYHNYLRATNHKDIEIYDLSNKEFKTAVLREFDKLHESIERQFTEIRETTH